SSFHVYILHWTLCHPSSQSLPLAADASFDIQQLLTDNYEAIAWGVAAAALGRQFLRYVLVIWRFSLLPACSIPFASLSLCLFLRLSNAFSLHPSMLVPWSLL